jgi:Putative Actinobacterial Holin-X, holin superfamily III
MSDVQDRSTPALMTDLLTHVSDLVKKEIALLRAEMGSKSEQVVIAIGTLAAAFALALTALNVLAAALVAAITQAGLSAVWAAVIVGGLIALIGFALASKGVSSLKASNLTPERTTRAAMRDASMIKEKM